MQSVSVECVEAFSSPYGILLLTLCRAEPLFVLVFFDCSRVVRASCLLEILSQSNM